MHMDVAAIGADSRVPLAALPRLVILLSGMSLKGGDMLGMPLRYAATAAAMDVAVEMHVVNQSLALLRHGAADAALLGHIRQAVALGVQIFACPVALAELGCGADDLIDEVAGVRGAASFLVAGLEPGARFLVF